MNISDIALTLDVGRNEDFWQPHVDAFNSMGITKVKYCKDHGVEYHKFLYWHQKLIRATTGNLLPVQLKSAGSANALCTVESPKGYRISIHTESALTKILSWL